MYVYNQCSLYSIKALWWSGGGADIGRRGHGFDSMQDQILKRYFEIEENQFPVTGPTGSAGRFHWFKVGELDGGFYGLTRPDCLPICGWTGRTGRSGPVFKTL